MDNTLSEGASLKPFTMACPAFSVDVDFTCVIIRKYFLIHLKKFDANGMNVIEKSCLVSTTKNYFEIISFDTFSFKVSSLAFYSADPNLNPMMVFVL